MTFEGKVCGFINFNSRAGKLMPFKELKASYLKVEPVPEKKEETEEEKEKRKKEEEEKKKKEEEEKKKKEEEEKKKKE